MPRKKKLPKYIAQRKNGTYKAQIPVGKNLPRVTLYSKSLEELEKRCDKLLEEVAQGLFQASVKTKDALLDWYNDPDLRYTTLNTRYRVIKNHILPVIGRLPVKDVEAHHIEQIYKRMREQGLSASTLTFARATLSTFFKAYYKSRRISRNPMDFVLKHPSVQHPKPNPLSLAEARKLLANDTEHTPIWTTMIYTGLRTSELLGLKWENINLEDNVIEVRQQVLRITSEDFEFAPLKTRTSRRDIKMNSLLRRTLESHKIRQLEERMKAEHWEDWGLVFTNSFNRNGRPIYKSHLSQCLQRELEDLGIEKRTPRHLRHTLASMNAAAGVPIKVTQEMMGHSTIKTTLDVYSATTPEMHADAADTLENFIEQTS